MARLAELRLAGVVIADDEGYELTESGRELVASVGPLGIWASRWRGSFDLALDHRLGVSDG